MVLLGALMVLVVAATNRREICFVRTNSARSTTFRRRVGPQLAYASRSTSQHFPMPAVFSLRNCNFGGEMWPDRPSKESLEAGVAMRGSVLVRGFDSSPFQPIWRPGGVGSVLFSFSGGPPHDFSYYIPIPQVWLCCAVYLFLSPCVLSFGLALPLLSLPS